MENKERKIRLKLRLYEAQREKIKGDLKNSKISLIKGIFGWLSYAAGKGLPEELPAILVKEDGGTQEEVRELFADFKTEVDEFFNQILKEDKNG